MKIRILVVDFDDRAKDYTRWLREEGYHVDLVPDHKEAIALFRRQRHDLVM